MLLFFKLLNPSSNRKFSKTTDAYIEDSLYTARHKHRGILIHKNLMTMMEGLYFY